jgi:hypothetical protein
VALVEVTRTNDTSIGINLPRKADREKALPMRCRGCPLSDRQRILCFDSRLSLDPGSCGSLVCYPSYGDAGYGYPSSGYAGYSYPSYGYGSTNLPGYRVARRVAIHRARWR